MPIESAQYINTLQPDWPLGSDPESAGDDHLRMVKQVLQNTFPKLTGAINATEVQINNLTGGIYFTASDGTSPARWGHHTPDNTANAALMSLSPTIAQLNANTALIPTWANLVAMLFPVGSVVVYADNVNPNTRLGFGTWVACSGYITGVGNVTDNDGTNNNAGGAGQNKGYWHLHKSHLYGDNITVNVSGSAASAGAHTHTTQMHLGGVGSTNDGGTHYASTGSGNADGSPLASSSAGAHTHSVTASGTFALGTASLPVQLPNYGFYVWRRTA